MKVYKPKKLIKGSLINEDPDKLYVAVPDKFSNQQIVVDYDGVTMTIKSWKNEAKQFKRFRDQYWTANSNRRQYYTLGYYEFKPDAE